MLDNVYLSIIIRTGSVFTANHVYGRFRPFFLLNLLTAGAEYIRVFSLNYYHMQYRLLNMIKQWCDINQHDLRGVDLRSVKSE